MYVIVEIQGQQFKVEKDQKLYVHHLGGEEGAEVEFEKVLLSDKEGSVTVGAPLIEGAKVVAEIINPLVKGDKLLVFHKRRRKGYRKLNGHRQQFSQIVIKDIQA
jgi:large subunit ribosomal protein L21